MSVSESLSNMTPAQEVRLLAEPSAGEAKLEELLSKMAWFGNRNLGAVEKTQKFVLAYNDSCAAMWPKLCEDWKGRSKSADLRKRLQANRWYLWGNELMAPWLVEKKDAFGVPVISLSPRWKHWVAARRSADKRFMAYDDYVNGAIHSSLKRGWTTLPIPSQLVNPKFLGTADKYTDATIPAYVSSLYVGTPVRTCSDRFFMAADFCEDPLQLDYLKWVAEQTNTAYSGGEPATRAWASFQKSGHIAASVSLSVALDFSHR